MAQRSGKEEGLVRAILGTCVHLRSGHGRAVNYAFFAYCPARITRTITPAGSRGLLRGRCHGPSQIKAALQPDHRELLKRGFLTEASVDKKTVRYRIGKSFAHHRATLELHGTLEASVASRQPFTWLNAVYLRVFRSHLQV